MNSAENVSVKPCPFCGGPAQIVHIDEGENAGGSCVCCTTCLASSNVEFEFKENFVDNWNLRSTPTENVSVKPLEWEVYGVDIWEFSSYPNPYLIGRQSGDGRFWVHHRIVGDLRGSDGRIALHGTANDAKAAAQADHGQRILSCLRSPPTEDGDRVIAWLGTNLDGESEPFLSERQAEFWSNGASKVEPLYLRAKQPFSERDATNLLSVIADIRAKSGLGVKPMLSELADAIAARITSPTPETVGVSDAMVERLFSEMTRRMELPKHIHQESNPEWLPVDDTQVGVEFAVEFLTAALSPQEGK